mmetsp:Transcript_27644/g.44541  ORF Transcript_27644/g.44541 Transcript_27644/m.44541 type:complete len:113 (-) Transcript_27644:745-1083(-)
MVRALLNRFHSFLTRNFSSSCFSCDNGKKRRKTVKVGCNLMMETKTHKVGWKDDEYSARSLIFHVFTLSSPSFFSYSISFGERRVLFSLLPLQLSLQNLLRLRCAKDHIQSR